MTPSISQRIAKVEEQLGRKLAKVTGDLESLARAVIKGINEIKEAIGVDGETKDN